MADERTVIGVDLGGTKIAAARYRVISWQPEAEQTIATQSKRGFKAVYEDLVELVESLRTASTGAVGVGVPGLVKQNESVILTLPNIPGAENFALAKALYTSTGLPCFVDNDANCFALAEATSTTARAHKVVVGITMGTGVGGGIVIDGRLFTGNHGWAGEIGHMLLRPGRPPYQTDDKRGDTEQFLAGTALGKRCPAAADPSEYLVGATCRSLHKKIHREVAWMCTNLIHLLDPGVIIFGGSAGASLAPHLPAIKKELAKWLLPGTPVPELKVAELSDAAVRGAAMLTQN